MTTKAYLSHIERTATEPRDENIHSVRLTRVTAVNSSIRLFRLSPVIDSQHPLDQSVSRRILTFLPGQWVDLFVPGILKPGGFTITSSPFQLSASPSGSDSYLELAVQNSPQNPPAAWLWRDENEILGRELAVRVGGSFYWPPPLLQGEKEEKAKGVSARSPQSIRRVVLVAGGVGINPLISILAFLAEEKKRTKQELGFKIVFLYTTRDPGPGRRSEILFWDRLEALFKELGSEGELKLFLTGLGKEEPEDRIGSNIGKAERRRIQEHDIMNALGPIRERDGTVCYVCGVPSMTDEFVDKMKRAEGMKEANVLCEKWW